MRAEQRADFGTKKGKQAGFLPETQYTTFLNLLTLTNELPIPENVGRSQNTRRHCLRCHAPSASPPPLLLLLFSHLPNFRNQRRMTGWSGYGVRKIPPNPKNAALNFSPQSTKSCKFLLPLLVLSTGRGWARIRDRCAPSGRGKKEEWKKVRKEQMRGECLSWRSR